MNTESRLMHFPIPFFAVVMGLAGFAIALQKGTAPGLLPPQPGMVVAAAGTVFVLIALLYLAKIIRYPQSVREELHHPVRLSFFPTASISLILLSICTLQAQPVLAEVLWVAGSVAHLLFTLYVLGAWINHEHFQIQHMNPAWFIPVGGNILVPIAGVPLGYVETSWFFFSIGLVFWVVLLVIVFYRVIFHNPLPAKPVLLQHDIDGFRAPPAAGFLAWLRLNGSEPDSFARVLYYAGLLMTLLLFTQYRESSPVCSSSSPGGRTPFRWRPSPWPA